MCPEEMDELEAILHQIDHRLRAIERRLEKMPIRADFDAALNEVSAAIDAAIARVGSGATFTDADIVTLKQDAAKINTIGGGTAPTAFDSFRFSPASVV